MAKYLMANSADLDISDLHCKSRVYPGSAGIGLKVCPNWEEILLQVFAVILKSLSTQCGKQGKYGSLLYLP